jgi:hypothetical protein
MKVVNLYKTIKIEEPKDEELFLKVFRDYDGIEKIFIGNVEEMSAPRFNRMEKLISEEETFAFDSDPANKDFVDFLKSDSTSH